MQVKRITKTRVLSTPGHLISLAARGFVRLSEARLKPLGFGVGHLPVLVALMNGRTETQRNLARFGKMEQSSMAQMLVRMERDGLIRRVPDPADGRSSLISLTEIAEERLPNASKVLFQGNREALDGFTEKETEQFIALLTRLIANLDRIAGVEALAHPDSRQVEPSIPIAQKRLRTSRSHVFSASDLHSEDGDR